MEQCGTFHGSHGQIYFEEELLSRWCVGPNGKSIGESTGNVIWLVLWDHGILWLSIYWEFHHPNWRTPWFFRGVAKNHQAVILWGGGVHNEILKRNSTNCGIIYTYSPLEIGPDMFIISINSAWTGMYITWCRSGSISHQTWWIMSTRCMMNIYMGWYMWPKSQTTITLLWWDRFWVNPEL